MINVFLINVLGSGTAAQVGEIHIRRSSASRQWQRAPRAYSTKPRRPKKGLALGYQKGDVNMDEDGQVHGKPSRAHTTASGTDTKMLVRPSELRLPHLPPWRTWRSTNGLKMFFVNGQDRREENIIA